MPEAACGGVCGALLSGERDPMRLPTCTRRWGLLQGRLPARARPRGSGVDEDGRINKDDDDDDDGDSDDERDPRACIVADFDNAPTRAPAPARVPAPAPVLATDDGMEDCQLALAARAGAAASSRLRFVVVVGANENVGKSGEGGAIEGGGWVEERAIPMGRRRRVGVRARRERLAAVWVGGATVEVPAAPLPPPLSPPLPPPLAPPLPPPLPPLPPRPPRPVADSSSSVAPLPL